MQMTANTQEPQSRPVFLTVLCILTFITSGLSFLGIVFNAIQGPVSQAKLLQGHDEMLRSTAEMRGQNLDSLADLFERLSAMAFYTNSMFYTMLLMNVLTFALGLGGAILMWKGRKIGFHSYILYNIVAILSVYVAVPIEEVPAIIIVVNVILSSIFIFMYSRNLKWLK